MSSISGVYHATFTDIVSIAACVAVPLLIAYCCVSIFCTLDRTNDVLAPVRDIELGRQPISHTPILTRQEPLPATNSVVVVYKRQEREDNNNDDGVADAESCSICLEEFKSGDSCLVLSCHHIYHDSCINLWLKINKDCPLCRNLVLGSMIKGDDNSYTTEQNLPGVEPSPIQV